MSFSKADIGRRVSVKGYECSGILRYVGPHVSKPGLRCGVELDEAVGKNNGTINVELLGCSVLF